MKVVGCHISSKQREGYTNFVAIELDTSCTRTILCTWKNSKMRGWNKKSKWHTWPSQSVNRKGWSRYRLCKGKGGLLSLNLGLLLVVLWSFGFYRVWKCRVKKWLFYGETTREDRWIGWNSRKKSIRSKLYIEVIITHGKEYVSDIKFTHVYGLVEAKTENRKEYNQMDRKKDKEVLR